MEKHHMATALLTEVEGQLLKDLEHYGLNCEGLSIDWSDICPEGHTTFHLDGWFESSSDVAVLDKDKNVIATGWLEFVNSEDNSALFIFWQYLSIKNTNGWNRIKESENLPAHVWNKLPDELKESCAAYGSGWRDSPCVTEWRRTRRS